MRILTSLLLCWLWLSLPLPAQWQIDGIAVSDTSGSQAVGSVISDGQGGAFIIWGDSRPGSGGGDIYAQHVDGEGNFYWEKQGRAIIQAPGMQFAPQAVPDGEGGFVMRWHDTRNDGSRDVYMQRVNFDGETLWQTNGVPVIIQPYDQAPIGLIRSSDGNYIVGWQDDRNHPDPSATYAQMISPNGELLWEENGVLASIRTGFPEIVSDLKGGGIFVWASFDGTRQLYAQRLDGKGNRLWGEDGVVASTNFAHWSDSRLSLSSDSVGGVIIGWEYSPGSDPANHNVFIQRLDSAGNRLWGDTGIQFGTPGLQQLAPQIGMLHKNRFVCVWFEFPQLYAPSLYLQKFDINGNPLFPAPGITINNYTASSEYQIMINRQKEIIIFAKKLVVLTPNTFHLYVHKVDSSGNLLWQDSSGVAVNRQPQVTTNSVQPLLTPDLQGGAIVSWIDYRKATRPDCYAQRVYADGRVGGDTTITGLEGRKKKEESTKKIEIESMYPNPFNAQITVVFSLEQPETVKIGIYNIKGQTIKTLSHHRFNGGKHAVQWNGTDHTGKEVSSGLYLVVF
ncbi:MAG: T9SS type A sorting domain-containing protein, partial [candidate division Zixibacteria bacterium]|nr:T9SS type A sorting domain-containing protein [candidate division Zixibacteria bacterium]